MSRSRHINNGLCRFNAFSPVLLILLCGGSDLRAQVLFGSITGNVSDQSGGAVAGARIVVTSQAENRSISTASNSSGGYNLVDLSPGDYTVEVTMSGFMSFRATNVRINADTVVRVNAPLQLGAAVESITVDATTESLQTDGADVRYEADLKSLEDLPTPVGRNYQAELALLPGFSVTGGGAVRGSNPAAAFQVNANGVAYEMNNVRIDGASAINNFNQNVTSYVPGLEAIQVVSAVTSSFGADTGLAAGASINVQIKSGGNNIHGSAFEYHTDNDLKARPALFPISQGKPKMIFNQFGGTVGGPIKRDKLFYFLSYDGVLSRQSYSTFTTVPTDAAKAGILTESGNPIYDPATGIANGSGRQPFSGKVIPLSRMSPISQKIIPLWPEPNQPGLANNFFVAASAPYDRHTVDTKVNYNISPRFTVTAHIGFLDWNEYYVPVFGTQLGGVAISGQQAGPANGTTINLTGGATYIITPGLVLDGYFGFNRSFQNVLPVDLNQKVGTDFLGIPGTNGPRNFEGGWPLISISGYNGIGVDQPYMPWIRHDPG